MSVSVCGYASWGLAWALLSRPLEGPHPSSLSSPSSPSPPQGIRYGVLLTHLDEELGVLEHGMVEVEEVGEGREAPVSAQGVWRTGEGGACSECQPLTCRNNGSLAALLAPTQPLGPGRGSGDGGGALHGRGVPVQTATPHYHRWVGELYARGREGKAVDKIRADLA